MFIHEAVKEALESGRYIIPEKFQGEIKIEPVKSLPCVIMKADGFCPSRCVWNPTAEDLTRNDWIVVD